MPLHEVLGVSPDADLATIKRAFRTLAKEWHPDRSRDPRADARFRELVSAYRILVHRANGTEAPRAYEPHAPGEKRPEASTATVDLSDDVSWVERPPLDMTIAYPARLARIVVLGTLGCVALLWISALLSHL